MGRHFFLGRRPRLVAGFGLHEGAIHRFLEPVVAQLVDVRLQEVVHLQPKSQRIGLQEGDRQTTLEKKSKRREKRN